MCERKLAQQPEVSGGYCLNSAWHRSSVVMKTVYVRRKSSRRVSAKIEKHTQGKQSSDKKGNRSSRPLNNVSSRNMTNGGRSGRG